MGGLRYNKKNNGNGGFGNGPYTSFASIPEDRWELAFGKKQEDTVDGSDKEKQTAD